MSSPLYHNPTTRSQNPGMSAATVLSVQCRGSFMFLLWIITYTIISFLVAVLPCPPIGFWLSFADFVKSKKDADTSDMACFFVLQMASAFIGIYVACLLINRHGPTIENLITYAMDDGSLLLEKEYDQKAAHDVGKVLVVVKNKRVIVTRCAFMVFQIVMYLMGCLAGVQFAGKPNPDMGLGFVAISSIFSVTTFKLFAASHQYLFTMAKWVVSHSIVVEILTIAYRDSSHPRHLMLQLFLGVFPIIVAVTSMVIPVEKLYAIHYAENQISYLDEERRLMSQISLTHEDIEKGNL